MTPDLRTYLEEQELSGRLERVPERMEPVYEIARRIFDRGTQLLLFEQVAGHTVPVVANVAACRSDVAAALGVEPTELLRHLVDRLGRPGEVRQVADAPFLSEAVPHPDLRDRLPLMCFYPEGRRTYVTAGVFCARHPRNGMNLSYHRMMHLGENRFSVRVVPRHLDQILALGEGRAEVAVAIGLHPAVGLAAATSFGPDFDELAWAASLLGQPLDCLDLDGLLVPAGAEVVWRGHFTGELAEEGPFVDLTGTYDGIRRQPVLEVDCMYSRPDPIYQVILPGGPEHRLLMGMPQEPRIFKIVNNAVADLKDLVLTDGGAGWLHAVVAVTQTAKGQAKNAGLAALAAHPSLKRVVVVDEDIDVHDAVDVEWAVATRVQPDRDLLVVPGARGSSLDPSRDTDDETTAKWVVDATRPFGRDPALFQRVEPPR